jgi:hypothetical protein
MLFQTISIEVVIILLAVAIALALTVCFVILKKKMRHEQRLVRVVSYVVREYFQKSGLEVTVSCVTLDLGKSFTVFIESEPMKRFRLSHIIESTLRDHVKKNCGLALDKVYWRFPIKDTQQGAAASGVRTERNVKEDTQGNSKVDSAHKDLDTSQGGNENKVVEEADNYINEGLVHYKNLPIVEVTELSWENFEEIATSAEQNKKTID